MKREAQFSRIAIIATFCHRLVMARIRLEIGTDLVQQFVREKEPVKAVIELLWNAMDADAHHVAVTIERNAAGGPDRVSVVDDGHGMTPERVDEAFRRVGSSWKSSALVSEGEKRPLHGSSGRGRLRAFALGSTVRWTTVAKDSAGTRFRTVITAKESSCNDFDVTEPVETHEPCGTTFTAWGKQSPYLARLLSERASGDIESALAPNLLAYPDVHIIFDGRGIDPLANRELDATYELTFWPRKQSPPSKIAGYRVGDWRRSQNSSLRRPQRPHR